LTNTNSTAASILDDWDKPIHTLWSTGNAKDAIQAAVEKLNACSEKKPKGLLVQLGYYLFLGNNYPAASVVFKNILTLYPDDKNVLLNLGHSLSKSKKYKESIRYISEHLKGNPKEFSGWDSLADSYAHLEDYEKSSKSGTNSLIIKDKLYGAADPKWQLPTTTIADHTYNKKRVIAFSLWGNEKRYIFGALRNLLLAPDLYPDWELWFYVDNSVSAGFLDIIRSLGGRVLPQEEKQSLREKSCWQFKVTQHEEVGYFLIRDIDSVFSVRECNAVQEWLDSGKWFHIIRDWWTHTELIQAGLWGGVAGVLPNTQNLFNNHPLNLASTPNIAQWFLRDCIWRYVKKSCLVHDRCFKHQASTTISGPIPANGIYIGSCEYHQRPGFQENILAAWIKQGRSE
jgi:hypothetical protein